MQSKHALRTEVLRWRRTLSEEDWLGRSRKICEHLLKLDELKNARCVHAFWPMLKKREVDIRPVIHSLVKSGCEVWLPIVRGADLKHGLFQGEQHLKPSALGVMEPKEAKERNIPSTEVIIVPALAIDKTGNRVGYGMGYYDSFLAQTSGLKVATLFANQVVEGIPSEPHDVPVDILVTELGAIAVH